MNESKPGCDYTFQALCCIARWRVSAILAVIPQIKCPYYGNCEASNCILTIPGRYWHQSHSKLLTFTH